MGKIEIKQKTKEYLSRHVGGGDTSIAAVTLHAEFHYGDRPWEGFLARDELCALSGVQTPRTHVSRDIKVFLFSFIIPFFITFHK